uniref:Uncharacterized protein n=1 Tax=Arundo donax TaxID=35708 RepID=A0A0A8ZP15_ARUDO
MGTINKPRQTCSSICMKTHGPVTNIH